MIQECFLILFENCGCVPVTMSAYGTSGILSAILHCGRMTIAFISSLMRRGRKDEHATRACDRTPHMRCTLDGVQPKISCRKRTHGQPISPWTNHMSIVPPRDWKQNVGKNQKSSRASVCHHFGILLPLTELQQYGVGNSVLGTQGTFVSSQHLAYMMASC